MTKDPVCIYCGASRPVAEPRCPACGHTWIDMTIEEALAPQRPDQVGYIEIRDFPVEADQTPTSKRSWRFPVMITAAAVAVYAIVFLVLVERSGPEDVPVAGPSTTAAGPTPDTTLAPQPTTAPTLAPTATTGPTASTAATTTTTSTTTTLPPIAATGDSIALEDLTLGAFSLGPLVFNDGDTNALGRLVATFGQPDDIYSIDEAEGLCPTDSGRAARFGWLTALLREEASIEVLVGYRLEEPAGGAIGHPTTELKTISGAAIGDTFARWNSIYRTSVVTQQEVEGVQVLLLLRSSDRRTLLWGPLTDDDPATMAGVFSPLPCDGGPFGTT